MTSHSTHVGIETILEDSLFIEEEKDLIRKFYDETNRRVEANSEVSLFDIAEAIDLDLSIVQKEGPVMYALWVAMLSVLKSHQNAEELKYPTLESFLEAYSGYYERESEEELLKLWETANWMSILFTLITARKNKGLAMQVIPKLVEGWHAKYVTGSGQTRLTANRVHIFETEGNTKANHRGKVKPKKKPHLKRAPRKATATSDFAVASPLKKRRRVADKFRSESPLVVDGHTDADDDSSINEEVNEDVQEAFKTWSSLPGGEADLMRSASVFELDSDLTPPSLQRGVSWTEIPISMITHSAPQLQRGVTGIGATSFSPPPLQGEQLGLELAPSYFLPPVPSPRYGSAHELGSPGAIESRYVGDVFAGYAAPSQPPADRSSMLW